MQAKIMLVRFCTVKLAIWKISAEIPASNILRIRRFLCCHWERRSRTGNAEVETFLTDTCLELDSLKTFPLNLELFLRFNNLPNSSASAERLFSLSSQIYLWHGSTSCQIATLNISCYCTQLSFGLLTFVNDLSYRNWQIQVVIEVALSTLNCL